VVDAAPARAWLRRLRRYLTFAELHAATGVYVTVLCDIEAGRQQLAHRDTVAAVLQTAIPNRMPRYELTAAARTERPGRPRRRRRKRWQVAAWEWVMVQRALEGRATQAQLNDIELERVVRKMTAAGHTDMEIGQRLQWGGPDAKDPEGAVTHYRGFRNIRPGRPDCSTRHRSAAPVGG
jgi:hypothetical protein